MSNPITNYSLVSSVLGTDLLWDWQGGAQQSCTAAQLKAYLLGGGSIAVASGKTLTASNTLTFTATDGSTIVLGAGGTVLYASGVGSTVQAWNAKLDAYAALSAPGTSGYILSATTGGTLSWIPPNLIATASGTNTYTATPSPALSAYNTGQAVFIKFTNANSGGASLNLNGLGAVTIQQNGAAVVAGQIPAGATLLLIYDGTYFQIVGNDAGGTFAIANLTGAGTGVLSALAAAVDGTGGVASHAAVAALPVVNVTSGTLSGGTATKTLPSGVTHAWAQSTSSGTPSGYLGVSISGTTATIASSNGSDTSTFDLFYWH